jgi:hypothetical protein
MPLLATGDIDIVNSAVGALIEAAACRRMTFTLRRDFGGYLAIRHAHGDDHINQVFDPRFADWDEEDFWVLGESFEGQPVATYCVRFFLTDDFYKLVSSQSLWFGRRPRPPGPKLEIQSQIPAFGGRILHSGGLWVRPDHRGRCRLASLLPSFARAISLQGCAFDHDSAMILNDQRDRPQMAERKAFFMGVRTYGFARVGRLVDGWFPPEGRDAIVHLCHSTRAEALASLTPSVSDFDRAPERHSLDPVRLSAPKGGWRARPHHKVARSTAHRNTFGAPL